MPSIKLIILFIIGFIVLSLIGLCLIGYYVEKSEPKTFSVVGSIVEIQDNSIKILEEERIIKININSNTEFSAKIIPAIIPEEIFEDLFQEQEIKLSDLKINDEIVAIGFGNIAESILRIQIYE